MEISSGSFILCSHCNTKPANLKCNECYPSDLFCASCDGYIHSFPQMRNHLRNFLFSKDSTLNQPAPAINSNLLHKQNYNPTPSRKVKMVKEEEKEKIISSRFKQLMSDSENAQKTLNDRIDFLQDKLVTMNIKHKQEMEYLKSNLTEQMDKSIKEKDIEIENLKFLLEEVKEENAQLKNQLKIVDNQMHMMKKGNMDLEREIVLLEEKEGDNNIVILYKGIIEKINESHEKEKMELIQSYEEQINKINERFLVAKGNYQSIMEKRENDFNIEKSIHKEKLDNLNGYIDQIRSEKIDAIQKALKQNTILINQIKTVGNERDNLTKQKKVLEKENNELKKELELQKVKYNQLEIEKGKLEDELNINKVKKFPTIEQKNN